MHPQGNNVVSLPKYRADRIEIRRANRKQNRSYRLAKAHKVTVPDLSSTFSFTMPKAKFGPSFRTTVPLAEFSSESLEWRIKTKQICYHPFLAVRFLPKVAVRATQTTGQTTGGFLIRYIPDVVLGVWDFDDQPIAQVQEQLSNVDFLKGVEYLLTPTPNNGTHLFIKLGMEDVERDGFCRNESDGETLWKTGARYRRYCEFQTGLCDLIERNTTLKTDRSVVGGHLAYNPSEISKINEFFPDKKTYKVNQSVLDEQARTASEERRLASNEAKLRPFLEEFRSFLLDGYDGSLSREIAQWAEMHCMANPVSLINYTYAVQYLLHHFEAISAHMISNWDKIALFASKKKKLGMHVHNTLQDMFGIPVTRHNTYIRRIVAYILGLKITTKYLKKVYTNEFEYDPSIIGNRLYFTQDSLETIWWGQRQANSPLFSAMNTAEKLSELMGNGSTHSTISVAVPLLVSLMGQEKALSILLEGLDLSCANDKNERRKEIYLYAQRVRTHHGRASLRKIA